ncbi:hypothetical protein IG631_00312 [Alternaria alternata]|nr:hypothetical protein IG631_00312 [Alternaria alternata]
MRALDPADSESCMLSLPDRRSPQSSSVSVEVVESRTFTAKCQNGSLWRLTSAGKPPFATSCLMAICITIGRACRIAEYSIHRSQSVRTLQGSLVDLQACRHQRFAVAMDGLDSGSFPRVIWLYHHALQ